MSQNNAQNIFTSFNNLKALVIGDVMIDSYLWGQVNRISPEAPVPVVNVKRREKRLGGAANVALNVKAMGASPILCAVVGQDQDARDFSELMQEADLSTDGILPSSDRITTIKHRILAGHQHMLRVDAEDTKLLNENDEKALFELIKKQIDTCHVVIFEDYDKGVLSPLLIQRIIRLTNERGIPTVVDPKKRNFLSYEGATLFKPNLKELKEGLKISFDENDKLSLEKAVKSLKNVLKVQQVLVTLSEQGVYLHQEDTQFHIPAHIRSIADVSGAGDTVISVAALCLALNLSAYQTAALANLAGGLVCESLGVVPIDKNRLLTEAIANQLF